MSLAAVIERSKRERESWHFTNLETLLKSAQDAPANDEGKVVASTLLPSIVEDPSQRRQIVFVNGVFSPDMSHLGALPPGVITSGAASEYRLRLEGETCLITAPIELVFVTEHGGEPIETSVKLTIDVGRSGRLTLVEHHLGSGVNTPAIARIVETDIRLGEQSKLVHGKIMLGESRAAHLATTRAHVAEGAYYTNFSLIKGRRIVRNEIEVNLEGPRSQCTLNGAMLLRGREHADTTTRIFHNAPHGASREVYKSIVAEQARGVFQAKIVVAEDAQKTDGYQLSRALLLSDQAEMNAKPELEIYADDVKCSHGSTVGDLDTDALFYLRSRGLNENEARGMLIHSFVDEILDEIQVSEFRDFCRTEVEGWLNEQN